MNDNQINQSVSQSTDQLTARLHEQNSNQD